MAVAAASTRIRPKAFSLTRLETMGRAGDLTIRHSGSKYTVRGGGISRDFTGPTLYGCLSALWEAYQAQAVTAAGMPTQGKRVVRSPTIAAGRQTAGARSRK